MTRNETREVFRIHQPDRTLQMKMQFLSPGESGYEYKGGSWERISEFAIHSTQNNDGAASLYYRTLNKFHFSGLASGMGNIGQGSGVFIDLRLYEVDKMTEFYVFDKPAKPKIGFTKEATEHQSLGSVLFFNRYEGLSLPNGAGRLVLRCTNLSYIEITDMVNEFDGLSSGGIGFINRSVEADTRTMS